MNHLKSSLYRQKLIEMSKKLKSNIIGGFEVQDFKEILNETRDLPELKKLFGDCWVEGEICVFV